MNDVLGQALYDYYTKAPPGKLWIHNKYGPKEEMPVHIYFREESTLPDHELIALQNCTGKVLDIGAGAGSHAILLQEKGVDVTALEISPAAAAVMKQRGVKSIVEKDIFEFETGGFDTLLLLMNGIGLTGNISRLKEFFQHAKKLLNPGGQLLFDSSDVAYLYEGKPPKMKNYYGEIMYQYEYKKQKTDWFTWLYIDRKKLTQVAKEEGWNTEILYRDQFDQYLAKLSTNQ
ncbi:class I SAM-dependent methyltransferase [Segetibacter koreensis]|uniref:class I SAM-dependent methyltransferase n=1 Tax=Segetibacter koreensis TaxID=398037 RepID=UPI00037A57CD|nr:class I SAM-dependent methyltransferase [Segetibacter koreensis]